MVRTMTTTTLKPHLVRADTIDLQDHTSPSAKDHTRQPAHTSPYGYGPVAPHQAQALRHAEQQAYKEQQTSPRLADFPSDQHQQFYDDPDDDRDDDHVVSHNGANGIGYHGQDLDDGEGGDSHDEDMDDDLMDKISSSPSIEDGKCPLPLWTLGADRMDYEASPASPSSRTHGNPRFPSPCSTPPDRFPTRVQRLFKSLSHQDEYGIYQNGSQGGDRSACDAGEEEMQHQKEQDLWWRQEQKEQQQQQQPQLTNPPPASSIPLSESQQFREYLLPAEDPLLASALLDQDAQYIDDDWEDMEPGYVTEDSSSDDDSPNFLSPEDDRFVDSGWGGECLREIEDIDFEFVYALHTFVATVEGQANATKGDTMVLLDDSNSYWWLVRVVKDGSIGYLPAEHIETPTERLARLNKHRNIDLSASMLGDNPEKSKNPLKKAMRRRNAKTVNFAPPTYYEPSDYEYSDEEEEDGEDDQLDHTGADNSQDDVESSDEQDGATTATTSADVQKQGQETATSNGIIRTVSNESLRVDTSTSPVKSGDLGTDQRQTDETASRSRKGNVRNTDSFFKDDTVETKKISLTPRLLLVDSDSNTSNGQELRQRPSLDTFDKMVGVDDKSKEKEKKKEKKGMLSGLFKRKDKSVKNSAHEEPERTSEDSRQSAQSKESLESNPTTRVEIGPERKPSKLQKTPPALLSPKASPTEPRAPQRDVAPAPLASSEAPSQASIPPAPTGPAPQPPTVRRIEPEPEEVEDVTATAPKQNHVQVNRFPSLSEKRTVYSPVAATVKSTTPNVETESSVEPLYSKRANEQVVIDHGGFEDESKNGNADGSGPQNVSPLVDAQDGRGRSDSGLPVSPLEAGRTTKSGPPQQPVTQRRSSSSSSSPPADAVIVESEETASTSKPSPSTATHTPSTSRSTPTWSDASLRTYMENDQDIKDLLIIVHDKSNVIPVSADHPLMTNLFSDERSKLADMQSQLDSMLMNWLSKKNASLLSTAT